MLRIRHSREGGKPALLAVIFVDSRLRGNDEQRPAFDLYYRFERASVLDVGARERDEIRSGFAIPSPFGRGTG